MWHAIERPDPSFAGDGLGSWRHLPHGSTHYSEETGSPRHCRRLLIDRAPVTNREFRKSVNATGHVTFGRSPDAKDHPGALPHAWPGSLVFTPTNHAVDLRD
jgi:formylglycine-generating enzyme required for sulfatase activity